MNAKKKTKSRRKRIKIDRKVIDRGVSILQKKLKKQDLNGKAIDRKSIEGLRSDKKKKKHN